MASNRGKTLTQERKTKQSIAMIGKRCALGCKRSLEFKQHLSDYGKNNPKHNHWVDGKGYERTSLRHQDMNRLEYRSWRLSVFERDNFTCQECGQRGGKLHADHIKPYATHVKLRYEITNGRTLCISCHRKTPTFGTKALSFSPQV